MTLRCKEKGRLRPAPPAESCPWSSWPWASNAPKEPRPLFELKRVWSVYLQGMILV